MKGPDMDELDERETRLKILMQMLDGIQIVSDALGRLIIQDAEALGVNVDDVKARREKSKLRLARDTH